MTPRPQLVGDRVRLRIEENGRPGPAAVEVVLNSRVTWRLRLIGGVSEQRLDLGDARLSGIDLVGGASRTRLLLPRLNGSLTVRMTGGVSELTVTVPGGPPVRVRVAAGAGSLTVYDERHGGIAAGDLVSSPGWDRATERLYLDLAAGANAVGGAPRGPAGAGAGLRSMQLKIALFRNAQLNCAKLDGTGPHKDARPADDPRRAAVASSMLERTALRRLDGPRSPR